MPKSINVQSFGARGDGISDDRQAIQYALNAVKGGGLLTFPPGVYGISGFVELADATGPLHIDGRGATLIAADKAPVDTWQGDLFRLTRYSNWTMEGLTLDGNRRARGPSEPAVTMRLMACSDFSLQGMRFLDSTCDSLYIAAGVPGKLEASCYNGAVGWCLFDRARRNGVSIIAGHHLRFSGNWFRNILENLPMAGIDIESNNNDAEGANHDIVVNEDNRFADLGTAVKLVNARNPYNITIDNNRAERVFQAFSQCDNPYRDKTKTTPGLIARGNQVWDVSSVAIAIFGENGELSGNRVTRGGNIGLYVDGGKGNLVKNNHTLDVGISADGKAFLTEYAGGGNYISGNIARVTVPKPGVVMYGLHPLDIAKDNQ